MTIITHDHEGYGVTSIPGQHDGCAEPGCFEDKIHYTPNMPQIESLMAISEECHQSILHNCTNNALTHLSWWVDRNGDYRKYWHGAYETGTEGCFCSLDGEGCSTDSVGHQVCDKCF